MAGDELTPTHDKGPVLGRQVAASKAYDPSQLFGLPRSNARATLAGSFTAYGEDVWHAYELSWLSQSGSPQMRVGVLRIPATSEAIVESKSLKLYLNSVNNHRFDSDQEAQRCFESDIGAVVGARVVFNVFHVDDARFAGAEINAECLDQLNVEALEEPDASALVGVDGDSHLCTHLMRSLCPVTAQPDWATVVVRTEGRAPDKSALQSYLLAYRNHQEFHEQCVERIYTDLVDRIQPSYLSVHALYTRRGGLDISPWRSSRNEPAPEYRLNRQ